jgi:hypothetical protein
MQSIVGISFPKVSQFTLVLILAVFCAFFGIACSGTPSPGSDDDLVIGSRTYTLAIEVTGDIIDGDTVSFSPTDPELRTATTSASTVEIWYTLAQGINTRTDRLTLYPSNGGSSQPIGTFSTVTFDPVRHVHDPVRHVYTLNSSHATGNTITITAAFLHDPREALDPPNAVTLGKNGVIGFIPGLNNTLAGATYTYTLLHGDTAVAGFIDKPIASFDSAPQTGIVEAMLSAVGEYTVQVTAKSEHNDFMPESVAASSSILAVHSVAIRINDLGGGDGTDSVSVVGAGLPTGSLFANGVVHVFHGDAVTLTANPAAIDERKVDWHDSGITDADNRNIRILSGITENVIVTANFFDGSVDPFDAPHTVTLDKDGRIGFLPGANNGVSGTTYTYTLLKDGLVFDSSFADGPISSGQIAPGLAARMLGTVGAYTVTVKAHYTPADPERPLFTPESPASEPPKTAVIVYSVGVTIAGGNGTDAVAVSKGGTAIGSYTSAVPSVFAFGDETVTLTAAPATGRLVSWSGNISGSNISGKVVTISGSAVAISLACTATFVIAPPLNPPTNVTLASSGMVSFTAGANNPTDTAYTYTLNRGGLPIAGFENVGIMRGGEIPSGIIAKMLENTGAYTVEITATTANENFHPQPVRASSTPALNVRSVTVHMSNATTGDSVAVNGVTYSGPVNVFEGALTSPLILTATPGSADRFVEWNGPSGGIVENTVTIHSVSGYLTYTAAFMQRIALHAPASVSFSTTGMINFTPGANNSAAGGVTYTFTLFNNNVPVGAAQYVNATIVSGSIPTLIVAEMLKVAGKYTVGVTAHTTNPAFTSSSAVASSGELDVYPITVNITNDGGTGGVIFRGERYSQTSNAINVIGGTTVTFTAEPGPDSVAEWVGGLGVGRNAFNIEGVTQTIIASVKFTDLWGSLRGVQSTDRNLNFNGQTLITYTYTGSGQRGWFQRTVNGEWLTGEMIQTGKVQIDLGQSHRINWKTSGSFPLGQLGTLFVEPDVGTAPPHAPNPQKRLTFTLALNTASFNSVTITVTDTGHNVVNQGNGGNNWNTQVIHGLRGVIMVTPNQDFINVKIDVDADDGWEYVENVVTVRQEIFKGTDDNFYWRNNNCNDQGIWSLGDALVYRSFDPHNSSSIIVRMRQGEQNAVFVSDPAGPDQDFAWNYNAPIWYPNTNHRTTTLDASFLGQNVGTAVIGLRGATLTPDRAPWPAGGREVTNAQYTVVFTLCESLSARNLVTGVTIGGTAATRPGNVGNVWTAVIPAITGPAQGASLPVILTFPP